MDTSVLIGNQVISGKNCLFHAFVIIGIEHGTQKTYIGTNALIRSHSVIYGGAQIGNDFQTGHGVLIREAVRIGNNVSIGSHTVIEHHVQIADNVRIHSNAFIPEYSILEEGCWLGPHVVLTNARYPQSKNVKHELKSPVIGKRAKIGANTTILPGIHIGAEALIGAGSVVTTDVPPRTVLVGNPARIINTIDTLPYA